jgi:hypothetical protein
MKDLDNLELLEESRRLIQQSRTLLDMGQIQMAHSRAILDEAKRIIAAASDHIAARGGDGWLARVHHARRHRCAYRDPGDRLQPMRQEGQGGG